MKILLLNGPNMNMLGKRDKNHYGTLTLKELEQCFYDYAQKNYGVEVVALSSNSEGQLIDILQQTDCQGVVFNPAGYTHYSIALRDCIECMSIPVVQVHLSDISAREQFRKINVLLDVTCGNFYGKGIDSYYLGLDKLMSVLNEKGKCNE